MKAAWLGATVKHEGFPLALRVRPEADTASHRKKLPHLVTLIHHLEKVRADGLPEAAYNHRLASFDSHVIERLERHGKALVVLVETFAGRRTYYAYSSLVGLGRKALAEIHKQYPSHRLSEFHKAREGWSLFRHYKELFPW